MALGITDHDGVITVTGTTSTATSIFTDRRGIRNIYWYRPTTQGHLLHFITGSNKDFVTFYCHSANYPQNLPLNGQKVTGLKIDDMDSGTVKIYWQK